MAAYNVVIYNSVLGKFQIPQVGDTYALPRDVAVTGDLAVSGAITCTTLNGLDIVTIGSVAATALQPGNNISVLTNDIIASQAEAESGADDTKMMTPLKVSQAIDALSPVDTVKNNYAALADPVATNDSSQGYAVGSSWINIVNDQYFRCVDASANVAVWVNMTADMTGAEIKAAYEAEANTNAFTDAAKLATDTGWRDLRCALVAAATGTGTPALTAFGTSGNIKQMAFGVGDSVYLAAHVDHDIKPGSTIYPHVHWTTNGTSTNTVKWELRYVTAKGHNQANFGADTVVNLEEAAQGTAWRHMVTEDATGFTAPEVDSVIIMELKRVTNGGTENADTVFGLFVDFHYESDRNATLNRAPDFYS